MQSSLADRRRRVGCKAMVEEPHFHNDAFSSHVGGVDRQVFE
jgi:hypothetical protein